MFRTTWSCFLGSRFLFSIFLLLPEGVLRAFSDGQSPVFLPAAYSEETRDLGKHPSVDVSRHPSVDA